MPRHTTPQKQALDAAVERLIDEDGPRWLIESVARVCASRADLAADSTSYRAWEDAAETLDIVALEIGGDFAGEPIKPFVPCRSCRVSGGVLLMLKPPPNIEATLRAMAQAIGSDAAYYDAMVAAYQMGVLIGQIDAKEEMAKKLDRAIFGRMPSIPTFLKRQAH